MLKSVGGVVSLLLLLPGCTLPAHSGDSAGRVLNVIAAENFWGSIAGQLGGDRARVQSVVTDPNADPHEYESNTDDARAFAQADLVILNGAGYDSWADKLLQANPNRQRQVLTVADLLGKKEGDNPHFWYNPQWVVQVSSEITARLKRLEGANSGYFDRQQAALVNALKPYQNRIAEIRLRFAGTKVGATESIFVYLAQALQLDLISPPEFMNAVGEGNDPSAPSVVRFQNQLAQKQIKVLVYNLQTATEVTTNLKQQAVQQNIPVVGISETMQPETATFEGWQLSQLMMLEKALNTGSIAK
ncbi:MAG: metal ABC transporter solute-binding protein, Zn/Mn family [Candidatus Dormibacteraceae bacterium]